MRKIFIQAVLFFVTALSPFSVRAGISGFSQAFGEIYLPDAQSALEMYIGRWDGGQKLFFNGQALGEGTFNQTCVARGDGKQMRVVATGKISYGDQTAISRSVMFVDSNGRLRVDVIGENGESETYYGLIEKNIITWVPKYLFLILDVQTDAFYVADKGVTMICNGVRYISTPTKSGYLGTTTILNKMSGTFDASQLSPTNAAAFGTQN